MTVLQVTAAYTQCKGQEYGYGLSRYNCKEDSPFLESHERNKSLAANEREMGIQAEGTDHAKSLWEAEERPIGVHTPIPETCEHTVYMAKGLS